MSDDIVHEWAPIYPHIHHQEPREAIDWLTRVFGFRERVRMAEPDGTIITSKLEGPGGGLWGLRTYLAIDLQGHQWEFGQTLRIVEPEEWGATRIG